jgi:hypothetical protein
VSDPIERIAHFGPGNPVFLVESRGRQKAPELSALKTLPFYFADMAGRLAIVVEFRGNKNSGDQKHLCSNVRKFGSFGYGTSYNPPVKRKVKIK